MQTSKMSNEDQILQDAEEFLRTEVAPKAQEIDGSTDALRVALKGLCDRNLMALRRPAAYGGPAMSEANFRRFQESVARYSGSLAFLQTQHQSAGSMIAKSKNEELRQEYLPKMASGEKLVGIGFSQLRRAEPPMLTATPVEGGYELNGNVPWITGYTFYPEFLIGATLPDGRAVFGVVPFENTDRSKESKIQNQESKISFSEPMRLAAMETALTVTAELQSWFLKEEQVVFIQAEDWIKNNDMINIVLQGHFALGCARAGLDILKANAEKKPLPFLKTTYDKLDEELESCRAATTRTEGLSIEERLNVRAWAIDLAVRCAHAGVTASSGAANSLTHPAQRVYREALVYTVSAQTAPIMEATLSRLVRE